LTVFHGLGPAMLRPNVALRISFSWPKPVLMHHSCNRLLIRSRHMSQGDLPLFPVSISSREGLQTTLQKTLLLVKGQALGLINQVNLVVRWTYIEMRWTTRQEQKSTTKKSD